MGVHAALVRRKALTGTLAPQWGHGRFVAVAECYVRLRSDRNPQCPVYPRDRRGLTYDGFAAGRSLVSLVSCYVARLRTMVLIGS